MAVVVVMSLMLWLSDREYPVRKTRRGGDGGNQGMKDRVLQSQVRVQEWLRWRYDDVVRWTVRKARDNKVPYPSVQLLWQSSI